MSQLIQLREGVVSAIQTMLPGFDAQAHLGIFDAAALQTFAARAPAVRVGVLNLLDPKATGGPETDYVARLGIYVVTADGVADLDRADSALAAVEAICRLSQGGRWGLDFTLSGARAAAQNLQSKELVGHGVAMWAIELRQPVRLHEPEAEAAIKLTELWVGFAPKVGAAHVADYLGPITGRDLAEAGDVG